jgi:endonuclease/exonuclease/phosphatase family metal-dependent hydrolase
VFPGSTRWWIHLACLLAAALGCAAGTNYTRPDEPRFAGGPLDTTRSAAAQGPGVPRPLRIVSFNIQFAREVEAAIRFLQADEDLRGADLIALQEMDEAGVERIAAALSYRYVYYPANLHPHHDRNFGNAILARWPLIDDRKIILPHRGDLRHLQRIAVAATVLIERQPVRVYSVHLGTSFEIDPGRRQDQLEVVLDDAAASPDPVIIAGDLNSHAIGDQAMARGYSWPTRDVGRTKWLFSWDHIYLRGFPPGAVLGAGRTRGTGGASDHRPVWAVVDLDRGERAHSAGDHDCWNTAQGRALLAAGSAGGP